MDARMVARVFLTGRAPVVLAACLVVAVVYGAHAIRGASWSDAWRVLKVPSLEHSFADLRGITHALDCQRIGINPSTDGRCDPWQRPYNYPNVWLRLVHLGLGSAQTNALGGLAIALLVGAFLVLFDPRHELTGLIAASAVLSPVVLLAVERGNSDILMFALLVLGFALAQRFRERGRTPFRIATLALAAVLKLYPLAAGWVLLRDRAALRVFAVGLAVMAVAVWLSLEPGELGSIASNTPEGIVAAYGSLPLVLALGERAGLTDTAMLRVAAQALALGVATLVAWLVVSARFKIERFVPSLQPGELLDDVALMCMTIFLGSYLVGASFDYRLVFLTGTLMPMLRYYEADDTARERLWAPAAVVGFMWLSRFTSHARYADELLGWIVFAGGCGWFTRTLLQRLGVLERSIT